MKRTWRLSLAGVVAATVAVLGAPCAAYSAAPSATTAPAPAPGGSYVPLTPSRLADTRTGQGGTKGPVTRLSVHTSPAGIPSGTAEAVVLNLSVVSPVGPGYISYGSGAGTGLSYATGQTVAGMVVVPTAPDGTVELFASRSTQLVVDIYGYFTTAAAARVTGLYKAINPTRVLDTRRVPAGPIGPGGRRSIHVLAAAGLAQTRISAVVINTTVVAPTAAGYVTAYPGQSAMPTTSTVNFVRNQTVANRAIVAVGSDGTITVGNSAGNTNVIVDVTGYLTAAPSGGAYYVPRCQTRLTDSRGQIVFNGAAGPLTGSEKIQVAGWYLGCQQAPVPFMTAVNRPVAALLAITSIRPASPGFASVYATNVPRPLSSDVNFAPGLTVTNAAISPVGPDGDVTLYSSSPSNFVADVLGYFAVAAPVPLTGQWAWGGFSATPLSVSGHLGNGSTDVPLAVGSQAVKAVALDGWSEYVVKADGTLTSYSFDSSTGVVTQDLLTNVASAATFNDFASTDFSGGIALRADGTVWAWGRNDALGQAGLRSSAVAVQITGITTAVAVAAGGDQGYALLADGTVRAWGANSAGQLGDGDTIDSPVPVEVSGLTDVTSISAGGAVALATHTDGSVSEWGSWGPHGKSGLIGTAPLLIDLPCHASLATAADVWQPTIACSDRSLHILVGTTIRNIPPPPGQVVAMAVDPEQFSDADYLLADGTVWQGESYAVAPDYVPIAGLSNVGGLTGSWFDNVVWT